MCPDLIVLPERVRTLDPERPLAEALAIAGGRVQAVGSRDEIIGLRAAGTEVITLDGACALPGFHDAHVHLAQYAMGLAALDLQDTPDQETALDRVAERARTLEAGAWITGAGFALDRWGVRSLEASALDAVAPNHPVLLKSQDHHAGWVNGAALAAAGIDRNTPDPEHGTIVRDPHGNPTGYLLEHAVGLVSAAVPPADATTLSGALDRAGAELAARGITTVHHMAYEPSNAWRAIADVASRDDYQLRVWACFPHADIEHAAAIGIATAQGGARFAVGGAKFFADGALGSRTALMLEPYVDSAELGTRIEPEEVLRERIELAARAGLTPVVHAIGDAAVRSVLDVLEATSGGWRAAGLRPRIEHAQHVHPDDLARFGSLGVVASMQPIHLSFDAASVAASLSDRLDRAFPMRSLAAAGALLAFGSDAPVARPDVFEGLRAAVRRRGFDGTTLPMEESIGVEEALTAFTYGAARAIGWERRSGLLRAGYDADVVVLDHDPVESLDDLEVLATLSAGRFTYRRAV